MRGAARATWAAAGAAALPPTYPPTVMGGNTAQVANGTTGFSIAQPPSLALAPFDVGLIVTRSNSGAFVAPAGWSAVGLLTNLFYKIYDGTEGAVLLTAPGGDSVASIAVVRYLHHTNPIDTSSSANGTTGSPTVPGSAITANYPGSMLISALRGSASAATTQVPPSGLTLVPNASLKVNRVATAFASKVPFAAAASSGSGSWSMSGGTVDGFGANQMLVFLRSQNT